MQQHMPFLCYIEIPKRFAAGKESCKAGIFVPCYIEIPKRFAAGKESCKAGIFVP